MRTEQQKPQPRSNQAPKSIAGDEECIPLLMYFMPFPVTAVHRKAEEWQPGWWAQMKHRCSSGERLHPRDPCSHSRSPQMCDRCVCSLPAPPKLYWEHCLVCFSLLRQNCYGSTCTYHSPCIQRCTDQTFPQVLDYSGLHVTMAVSSKCSERN